MNLRCLFQRAAQQNQKALARLIYVRALIESETALPGI
jgi:hypothetical protein